LSEALFAKLVRRLDAASFMGKAGMLIVSSLVEAAVHRPAEGLSDQRQGSWLPRDPAKWTRAGKERRPFFGDQIHIGIDQESGMIRSRG
jgi:hypothetical protein